jgi:hypothetical protein
MRSGADVKAVRKVSELGSDSGLNFLGLFPDTRPLPATEIVTGEHRSQVAVWAEGMG